MLLSHLVKRLKRTDKAHNQKKEITTPSTPPTDHEVVKKAIRSATVAQNHIVKFRNNEIATPVSLGQNCNTAWYLKQVGAKTASYPFDWIFSSSDIALSCIKNNFSTFLNKKYITPKDDNNSAGHTVYHNNLFNHRNPLKTLEDYQYYVRCVTRFQNLISSDGNILFICTLLNEPNKRPLWKNGFTTKHTLPKNQSYNDYQPFIRSFKDTHPNTKFIFIEQYTEETPYISCDTINQDILSIKFTSYGPNNGYRYTNDLDDFLAKLLYSGLVI